MEVLAYMQIFALYFSGILLYFLPGSITYKTFALIISIVSALTIIRFLLGRKMKIKSTSLIVILVMSIIVICFKFITPTLYSGTPPANYNGEFLALLGQTFPGVLTALAFSTMDEKQTKMKKAAIYVSLLFTFIAFICTIRPTASTSGGFADNENNLNYQSLSYLAAYGAALAEYYLLCYESVTIKATKVAKIIAAVVIVLNLFTILLTGGRGGLVAYAVFAFITIILFAKKNQWTATQIIKGLGAFILVVIGLYFAIQFASNSTISTSGFRRIISFLNRSGDSIRESLRSRAIQSFQEKPILGHGVGAVYYELGFYSHNFILDLLVETGIVGTSISVFVLLYVLHSLIKLIKQDLSDSFWLFLLLCGIIELTFSGYYIASICTWWVCVFIIAKMKTNAIY